MAATLAVAASAWAPSTRPNFLVLFVDDMGINQLNLGDARLYGYTGDNGTIDTPNIRALAGGGMTFQSWYSSFHVCSPSRASMMTGRLSIRAGVGLPPCDYAPHAYNETMCNSAVMVLGNGSFRLCNWQEDATDVWSKCRFMENFTCSFFPSPPPLLPLPAPPPSTPPVRTP